MIKGDTRSLDPSSSGKVFMTRFGRVHILMAFGIVHDRPGKHRSGLGVRV